MTQGWCLVRIATEGDGTRVGGVSLWDADWTPTRGRIIVAHPQYPSHRHVLGTYEVAGTERPVSFAAGEFSNGVWGIYVPC